MSFFYFLDHSKGSFQVWGPVWLFVTFWYCKVRNYYIPCPVHKLKNHPLLGAHFSFKATFHIWQPFSLTMTWGQAMSQWYRPIITGCGKMWYEYEPSDQSQDIKVPAKTSEYMFWVVKQATALWLHLNNFKRKEFKCSQAWNLTIRLLQQLENNRAGQEKESTDLKTDQ